MVSGAMRLPFCIVLVLLLVAGGVAHAQDFTSLGSAGDGLLEIEADDALEWDQANRRYVARGNALARRGENSVRADRLVALYREDDGEGQQVYRFEAAGNVVIQSAGNRATGAIASYDLDERLAILTGGNLRLEAEGTVITASERLEYDEESRQARAIGNATVIRQGNRLEAPTIVANFTTDSTGQTVLRDAEATGGVRITTETDIATGQRGIYNEQTGEARLTGDVRLCRDKEIGMSGTEATVNMETGNADIKGGPSGGQRARVTFAPGQQPVQGFDPCANLR